MPEGAEGTPVTDDLLTKLSNRINSLEAQLSSLQKENQKSYVDHAYFDSKILEVRNEISSLKETKTELKQKAVAPKEAPKEESFLEALGMEDLDALR